MSQFSRYPVVGGGSDFWGDAVANFAALPVTGAVGEIRLTLDTNDLYTWNGSAWVSFIDTSAIADHIADTADAHDASAISSVAAGNLAATDVQAALNELQSDIDTRALSSDLSNHLTDTTDAHDASAISSVAAGNLVATDVQAALNELQSDIDTRALSSDLTTHMSDTSTHGVGAIVGETESATLSNKTMSGAANTFSNIASTSTTFSTETSLNIGTSATDTTVNIATGSGANVVNLGGTGSTINMYGTVNNQDVTNLNVTDKLITINDGGAVASGGSSGIEIEENAVATGYSKTSGDRNSWTFKAPNTAGIASLTPGATDDTVALLVASQALTNKTIVVASNTVTTAASGNLAATELNAALSELQSDIDTRATATSVSDHLTDTSDAHDASAISSVASGNLAATDVQSALNELQSDIDTRALSSDLSNHLSDTSDAHDASAISSVASGNLAATDVQAALNELQSDVDTRLVDELTTKGDLLVRGTSAEQRLAVGSDGQVLKADSSATNGVSWANLSSGGINFVSNPDAESATTGWATYADAAGTSPVDGTGGSPNSTWTRTTTSAEILRGAASFKLTKGAANRQGEGVSYDFTIDKADKGDALTLAFDYYFDSANYEASSELVTAFVYDVTNATLITVNANESFNGNIGATGAVGPEGMRQFIGQFYASSSSTSYRLILHIAGTGTSAWNMFADNFRVGPEAFYNMPIVQYMGSYSPTLAWTSGISTKSAKYWRIGDMMKIEGYCDLSGAPTATDFTFALPSGYTIDTGKVSDTGAGNSTLGSATIYDNATREYVGQVVYNNTTSVYVIHSESGNNGFVNATNPITFGANDNVNVNFMVPILEWANSSTTMSTAQASLQTQAALYTSNAGQSISSGSTTIINFEDKVEDTHNAVTTGASWKYTAPVRQRVDVDVRALLVSSSWTAGNTIELYLFKNGSEYARLRIKRIETTGTYQFLADGQAQGISLAAGDYIDVRIAQNSGSSINLDTSALVNRIAILSRPDFNTIGVYSPYEVKSSSSDTSTAWGAASGTAWDVASVVLTPGTWELQGSLLSLNNGAVTAGDNNTWLGAISGNNSSEMTMANGHCRVSNAGTSGNWYNLRSEYIGVTVTSTTTYYLKASYSATTTNLQYRYNFVARRLK